jgi:hypothetical protein
MSGDHFVEVGRPRNEWPICRPRIKSHTINVPSADPENARWPSDNTARQVMLAGNASCVTTDGRLPYARSGPYADCKAYENVAQCMGGAASTTMKQFKSAGQAQRFLSAHDQINNLFQLRRDHVSAADHRASRAQNFQVWAEICCTG